MTRTTICGLLLLAAPALRSDDRAPDDGGRRARVALALAAPPAAERNRCDCRETGRCPCPDKPCDCCEGGLPGYYAQHARALKEGRVLVGFHGCRGSCHDGALCGAQAECGGEPAVWVGYPKGGRLLVAARLPADAAPADIAAAIRTARAKAAEPESGGGAMAAPFAADCPSCRAR